MCVCVIRFISENITVCVCSCVCVIRFISDSITQQYILAPSVMICLGSLFAHCELSDGELSSCELSLS